MASTKKAHHGRMTLLGLGAGRVELREARVMDFPQRAAETAAELAELAGDLRAAVRLLLICHTHREREVCGYKLMHGMSDGEAGARVDLTANRVKEIFSGLLRRAGAADANKHHLAKVEALAEIAPNFRKGIPCKTERKQRLEQRRGRQQERRRARRSM